MYLLWNLFCCWSCCCYNTTARTTSWGYCLTKFKRKILPKQKEVIKSIKHIYDMLEKMVDFTTSESFKFITLLLYLWPGWMKNICSIIQSFTFLMANLHQDINRPYLLWKIHLYLANVLMEHAFSIFLKDYSVKTLAWEESQIQIIHFE